MQGQHWMSPRLSEEVTPKKWGLRAGGPPQQEAAATLWRRGRGKCGRWAGHGPGEGLPSQVWVRGAGSPLAGESLASCSHSPARWTQPDAESALCTGPANGV